MEDGSSHLDKHGPGHFSGIFCALIVLVAVTQFVSLRVGGMIVENDVRNYDSERAAAQAKLDSIFKDRAAQKALASAREAASARSIPAFDVASHIPVSGKAIAADLSGMKVTLFDDGTDVAEYPIISIGKDGSRWQTPVGSYAIQTKEKSHFSSIGGVYMPYSMEFYGNFFIHGWPTYPGGAPVRLGYTGGCIRLATDDAKKVFAFADIGIPIFVYEGTTSEPIEPAISLAGPAPQVGAESYIVADIRTGQVFSEKNADEVRPLASLAKLITSIVANEAITYDKKVAISEHVIDTLGEKTLKLGDTLTDTELQYPLLMQSDNGAAVALADAFGNRGFIALMNEKAKAIGMDSTQFVDPTGISDADVSSAEDLFRLSRYLYDNEQYILSITKLPQKTIPATANNQRYALNNFNVFSAMPEFEGGKTGQTTAAKQTMVALFSYADPGDPTSTSTLAVIVLGSDDRKADVTSLYDWTLASLNSPPAVAVSK